MTASMVISCEHCGARYKVDESRIPGRGAKVTCPRCREVFVVRRNPTSAATDPVDPRGSASPAAPAGDGAIADPPAEEAVDVESLDFRAVGLSTWKVRVRIGLVYDFSDVATLRRYVKEGRLGAEDLVSADGVEWTPLGGIADLDRWLVERYREAERAMREAREAGDDFDDVPTSVFGMEDEGGDAEAPVAADLEAAAAELAGAVDGGGVPEAAYRFDDPFERLEARRRARRKAAPAPPPAATQPSARNPAARAWIAVAVVLALGGVAWLARPRPPEPAPVAVRPLEVGPVPPPEKTRESILHELEASLPEAEEPPDEEDAWTVPEEQELIPVRPDDAVVAPPPVLAAPAADPAAEAEAAMARGDWDAAIAAWRRALELRPAEARYHERLGVALYRKGALDEAVVELRAALAGGEAGAHRWLGDIAAQNGDTAGALGHYHSYLKVHPGDVEVRRRVAALQGG